MIKKHKNTCKTPKNVLYYNRKGIIKNTEICHFVVCRIQKTI